MGRRTGAAVAGDVNQIRVEVAGRLLRLLRLLRQPAQDDEVAIAVNDLLLDRVIYTDRT